MQWCIQSKRVANRLNPAHRWAKWLCRFSSRRQIFGREQTDRDKLPPEIGILHRGLHEVSWKCNVKINFKVLIIGVVSKSAFEWIFRTSHLIYQTLRTSEWMQSPQRWIQMTSKHTVFVMVMLKYSRRRWCRQPNTIPPLRICWQAIGSFGSWREHCASKIGFDIWKRMATHTHTKWNHKIKLNQQNNRMSTCKCC